MKPNGVGYTARCPGHDDRLNSLKVDTGKDGQALIHCHAGCEPQRVVAALGWTLADLYPPRAEQHLRTGTVAASSPPTTIPTSTALLQFQAVRFEPKGFAQRRPDGNGGWIWNLDGVQRVLYRLPELLAADTADWVLIAEGEKDVDRLAELGFVATTNAGARASGGRSTPSVARPARRAPARQRRAGREARRDRRSRSAGVAAEVRVLRLPNLPPKGDVSDWLDAGGTREALERLIAEAPAWNPRQEADAESAGPRRHGRHASLCPRSPMSVSQPVAWDWFRWLPRGKFHLLGGYAGDGKSTLLAALAATGSRGGTVAGRYLCPRVIRTLFLLGEDSAADTLTPRLELHDADMDQIFVIETVLDESGRERFFNIGKHLDLLEERSSEHGIDWIVIDPLTTIMPGTDRNAEGDTRDALTPLIKLADRRNVTITGVAHVGKSGDAAAPPRRSRGNRVSRPGPRRLDGGAG